jgi:hypothetical protein
VTGEILRGSLLKRTIRNHATGCTRCASGEGHPLSVLTVSYPGGRTRQFSLRRERVRGTHQRDQTATRAYGRPSGEWVEDVCAEGTPWFAAALVNRYTSDLDGMSGRMTGHFS